MPQLHKHFRTAVLKVYAVCCALLFCSFAMVCIAGATAGTIYLLYYLL
jgi:hypothetical protein